jgi:hydrogenase nickel incorporation protein HypB
VLDLAQPILARNDRLAERNRGFLRAKGVWSVNLVSSPGSGKTTLLERTLTVLNEGDRRRASVIVGDLATARDAQRLRAAGADAVQITTGEACHLDAEMVARGMDQLDLSQCRWLFIENVGNLVCPAAFDLGEHRRVALVSVTEGEDKPLKYPVIFKSADLVVVTKMDLAAVCGAEVDQLTANLRAVNPEATVLKVSARSGEGMAAWMAWIRDSSANPSSGFSKLAEPA